MGGRYSYGVRQGKGLCKITKKGDLDFRVGGTPIMGGVTKYGLMGGGERLLLCLKPKRNDNKNTYASR